MAAAFRAGPTRGRLAARYALAYAVSIVVCMAVQLQSQRHVRIDVAGVGDALAALYVLVAVPFTLSGVFMCLVLVRAEERIGAVYSADLIGAAVGCALFVPFAAYGEGPRGVLLLGALAALGAALVATGGGGPPHCAAALLAVGLCAGAFVGHFDRERAAGALGRKGARIRCTRSKSGTPSRACSSIRSASRRSAGA